MTLKRPGDHIDEMADPRLAVTHLRAGSAPRTRKVTTRQRTQAMSTGAPLPSTLAGARGVADHGGVCRIYPSSKPAHRGVRQPTENAEEYVVSVSVIMPKMGETVEEGTVNAWFAGPGDRVASGEPLLEIGTDKVDSELVAPASGLLREIHVSAGETVPIGTLLAVIDQD